MEVLKLENLSKYYTSANSVVMGLTGINLSFRVGEFVAVTGESGSGKSTLAHVLGGILPYESGELYIYGQPTSHYDSSDWERYRRDLISFISQNYGILPGNTVIENVESALRLGGMDKEDARSRAEAILEEVELSEFRKRKAAKLSSGQKQRLSIARALAKPSKILLADEPTGNLDRENSEKVIKLLKRASKDRLVILITHEFEEAKDVATRRIVLSDGAVVTDARLSAKDTEKAENECCNSKNTNSSLSASNKNERKKPLSFYVTSLTLKSRPVFSAILCLLLAVTTFITFVFLGTFTVSLDDSSTRLYDTGAFYNGDRERIVVMKTDKTAFTEEDYEAILSVKYAQSIERSGYINDINYYYKKDVDYRLYEDIVTGPNYHPVKNPSDYHVTELVEFYETEPIFLRTVPYAKNNIITEGRMPEGVYEVISADPELKVGDSVNVYIRNKKNWGASAYIKMSFDVVGETSFGDGLYFSDKFAAMINGSVNFYKTLGEISSSSSVSLPLSYIFAPYDEDSFVPKNVDGEFVLGEHEFMFPAGKVIGSFKVGDTFTLWDQDGNQIVMTCAALYDTAYTNLVIVSDEIFEKFTDFSPVNQVSLYIKDYAYAERVMDSLTDKGYIAISPFKLGATEAEPELAIERIITLAVCALALVLSFVLQSILLKAMFSSLQEYFKLMSNIGLTAKTAYISLSLTLLILTLIAEAVGAGVIIALNMSGISHIVNIFKYLDVGSLLLLFVAHFISVALALLGILSSMRRAIFAKSKQHDDIDFSLMEEAAL